MEHHNIVKIVGLNFVYSKILFVASVQYFKYLYYFLIDTQWLPYEVSTNLCFT